MGKQKSLIAVANKILQVCYTILRDHVVYKKVEIAQENKMEERKIKKMISLLEKSGYEINITPLQTNVNIL